ncbi:class IV adenylate cyclase [Oscillatoria amoena NRMC-F 0135]|jgi:predicted adenylyl cyclase CyaB|nr:class IV adenylate cyclase [Oscillatoria amoena NRMC-F 0135]
MAYKDYTLKARLTNFSSIKHALTQLNAVFVGTDHQADYYFKVSKGKLKLRQGTIENVITHYERKSENGIEKTVVYRYDKNPSVEEIASLRKHASLIGKVEKERSIYFIENVKIHLDTMPDGQQFIEIEAIDTANRFTDEDLKAQCFGIKSKLGVKDEDLLTTGYFLK